MKELGLPTDTWAVIFDPKYLEKVKGKVTVLDSQRELFAAALIYLGYPVNDTDPAKLQRGPRYDTARQTVLGSVQRVVVHQRANGRQHLARAWIFERHVPGHQDARRPGARSRSAIHAEAGRGTCGG